MEGLLISALLGPVEALVNAGVKQDMKLSRGLAAHAGKLLEIEVTAPRLRLLVNITGPGIRLGLRPGSASGQTAGVREDIEPDGRISGSASTLMGLLLDRRGDHGLVNPALKVTGDSEFVAEIHRLFRELEIDWQSRLSDLIGDVPTHLLEELISGVTRFTRESARAVHRNLDEYLHEESRLVPPLNQVSLLDQQLDGLRLRLDRLEARVRRLAETLESPHYKPRIP